MEKELFFKIVIAVNLVWLLWTLVHKRKKPEAADPAIAAANAAERHHWRNLHRALRLCYFIITLWFIWMSLKFILA